MLIDFFLHLRSAKLPVSVKEYLLLLEALSKGVIGASIDDFYHLSRASLVKDEMDALSRPPAKAPPPPVSQ